jgi:hypothetical protein
MSQGIAISLEGFLAITRHLVARIQRLEAMLSPPTADASPVQLAVAPPPTADAPPHRRCRALKKRAAMPRTPMRLEDYWVQLCRSRRLVATPDSAARLQQLLEKQNRKKVEENV